MPNSRGISAELKGHPASGRQSFLPPRSPFISLPSFSDAASGSSMGPKGIPMLKDGYRSHQRTSSESLLIEEQPSWLDELLNEPETPVRKGHRRSSSDSFAYSDTSSAISEIGKIVHDEWRYGKLAPASSWEPDIVHAREIQQACLRMEANSCERRANRGYELSINATPYHPTRCSSPLEKNTIPVQNVMLCPTRESDKPLSSSIGRNDQGECLRDSPASCERKNGSHAKSTPDIDPKRAKQQFAQRSRVRKLQYIAELERNVHALQAEGSEVVAELEFLDQQNIILGMENKALKQRLESLAQEQLIKYLEHEMLEKEIARLRALMYQQQASPSLSQANQKQPQQSSVHHQRQNSSNNLEAQFATLSLKHKESGSNRDTVSGPLQI